MRSPSGHRHDLHTHVFAKSCAVVPGARYAPDHEALPGQLREAAREQGIDRVLLVQPSFLGTDNSYALDTAAAEPEAFRVAVVLDAEAPDLELLENPLVVGVRLNLIGARAPRLDSPQWQDVAHLLQRRGSHLEIQGETGLWPDLLDAIRRWPGLVVIDHLGRPAGDDPALDAVLELDHVWAKVSGFYRADREAVIRRLAAVLESMPDRLVWGSDWPFTQHEDAHCYPEVVASARHEMSDQLWDQITIANPSRLIPWEPPH